MNAYEETIKDDKNKIADLKVMLTQMNEQLAKELKKCDKAAIANMKKQLASARSSAVGRQILDRICSLVDGNQDGSYAVQGLDIIDSETGFSSKVKKCDPSKLDKAYLSQLAGEITMDNDGRRGKILESLMSSSGVQDNVVYFPFFKVLFKLNQIGLTVRNRNALQRGIEGTEKTIAEAKISMDSTFELMENLNFQESMMAEMERSRNEDMQVIVNKQSELQQKINAIAFCQDQQAFAQWYYENM